MKLAIISEKKTPPDRRVVLSPVACRKAMDQYKDALDIVVEPSEIRAFTDQQYKDQGIVVTSNITDADVLVGVKEVPISCILPNKKYFFFSHTIKKQPYNRDLLCTVLKQKSELYDHETIVNAKDMRLIGFGRYAGIVGMYNGFRAYGLKHGLWHIAKANTLQDQKELIAVLAELKLPAMRILLTGSGRVAGGVVEMLEAIGVVQVTPEQYLDNTYNKAVFTQIDALDYNTRIDGKILDKYDFFNNPEQYKSTFSRFTKHTDFLITGHFYGQGAPVIFSAQDAKDTTISVVADISCDIAGPIACTLRASTIADPIYGYDKNTQKEVSFLHPDAIAVMAVDNLPCELPKDASNGFGDMFLKHVLPAFFNQDKDGILQRAQITTKDGTLTPRFAYLQDYVDGKE